jgi:LEA14-like dessication related protein
MKIRRSFGALALSLVAVSFTGCASLARASFANPIVELRDVRLKGVGMNGGSVDILLDVYNPNAYRLDASKVSYNLYVDSATVPVAKGEVTRLVTLEKQKKTEVTLPVSFTIKELMGAAKVLTGTGSINYRVTGDVTVSTPTGSITRPYTASGRYDTLRP